MIKHKLPANNWGQGLIVLSDRSLVIEVQNHVGTARHAMHVCFGRVRDTGAAKRREQSSCYEPLALAPFVIGSPERVIKSGEARYHTNVAQTCPDNETSLRGRGRRKSVRRQHEVLDETNRSGEEGVTSPMKVAKNTNELVVRLLDKDFSEGGKKGRSFPPELANAWWRRRRWWCYMLEISFPMPPKSRSRSSKIVEAM
jgi:hypothetical protein